MYNGSGLIGESMSEPHIYNFAADFQCLYTCMYSVNHFLLVFCMSLCHALIQTTNVLASYPGPTRGTCGPGNEATSMSQLQH